MTDLFDRRVEALFDIVADLPPEERARVLEERSGGDAELCRQVLALLECDTPSGVRGTATARAVRERIGTRIGAFEITALLGEGGMGSVYLAEQKEPIRRRVALKIIKLGMDTRRVIARFEMERQVLALLDHRNIARVLDAGATERGRPYFVMELVEGEPLTRYCDARSLDVRARLGLFLAVCRGVQHAHHRGVIHRDLKPSNVLVREVEGEAVPKIIDFGVAKATRPELRGLTEVTEQHQILGTPDYMSPEQAGFGDREVDTRSDIYSLGVLLYELLTGVTPHARSTDYAEVATPSRRLETLPDQIEKIAEVRACTPRALKKHLCNGLDWIALKCLELQKERRYDSAAAVARDIERYLADEPLAAGPPDLGYRVRKFARRHRTALGVTAFVTVAFLVVVAVFLSALLDKSVEEREARKKAEAALRANQIERGRLLGMTGNLSLAEELLWGQYLLDPSAAARWALWELYWRRPCLATRAAAGDVIDAIDFHPSAPIFATGQRSGIVRLWGTDPLRSTAVLEGHDNLVMGVAFSPDGRVLASASLDGTIRLWDPATGAVRRILEPGAGVSSVDLSPDGRWVAGGDVQGTVRIWQISTGRLLGASEATGVPRRVVVFDRTGRRLAAGRDDSVIDVFAIDGGKLSPVFELRGHTSWVLTLAFGPDDRTLYSGSVDSTVRLWDLASRACLKTVQPGIGPIRDIGRSPQGDVFLLSNQAVDRWSGNLDRRLTNMRDPHANTMARSGKYSCIAGAGVRPDGRITGLVRLFETEPGRALAKTKAHEGIAYALAVSARGVFATAGTDGLVRLSGRDEPLGRHAAQVDAAAFTPDGRHLATGSVDGEVRLWDVGSGSIVARRRGFSAAGAPLAMAPSGDRFVTGRSDGKISVWAVPSGELLAEHRVSAAEVVWLAFSPDGRRLASAARDRAVRVWDARSFERLAELVHELVPWSLAFSNDGATLAVGSWDQRVHLWDVARQARVGVLKGHHGLVRSVAFAPSRLRARLGIDGLVSASHDGTLKLWDLQTRTCVLTLPCDEPAYSVAFLEGPRLASTHGRGTLATWDLSYYDRHIEGNRAHQQRLFNSRSAR